MRSLVLILILLALTSCSPRLGKARHGGTLRLTHKGADPKTFNPWIASDATSSNFASILFDGLFRSDPDTDETVPHMAESYEIQDEGKTIIVKLRDGLYWSDGMPISSEDVVYTWNTLIRDEVAISSLRDILTVDGKFPKVRAIDDRTISFETEQIFAPFLKSIGLEIAPKHDVERFLAKHQAKTLEQKQKAFNQYLNTKTPPQEIVNSGAFRLQQIKSGERIELVPNPRFFLKDEEGKQLPYLDKIVYSYVQDTSAAVFKFLAKESHTLNVTQQNAAFIKSLERKYDFTLYDLGPNSGTNFIWFNLSSNVAEPKYSWFNNLNFRKAISYTIDRDNIVNNVFQGLGAPLFTAESLISPFLNQEIAKGHKRDIAKAMSLLEQAGFKTRINAKTNEKELIDQNNNRVEFNLFTNAGNQERELITVIIADNLKEIGIKTNVKFIEFNNLVARLMQSKDYEAGIMGLTGSNEPHNGANVWKSDGRLHLFDVKQHQPQAITRDWEHDIDKLLNAGVQVMDFDKRKAIYDEFQEIVYKHKPLIYIASPKSLTAVNNQVAGVRKTKYAGVMPYLYKVYIKS